MKTSRPILTDPITLTDGATINTDASSGSIFDVTIAANRTMAAPTNAVDGKAIEYRITQSGSTRLITWNGAFAFEGGTAPTLSAATGKVDLIGFQYHDGKSKWLCTGFTLGF